MNPRPASTARPCWRVAALAAASLLVMTCDPAASPTAPPDNPLAQGDSTAARRQRGPGEMFSDRARVVDPALFPLVSTPGDLAAGRYRYRVGDQTPGSIERDDVLVSTDGKQPFVRLVLSSQKVADELVLETAPALWSDVIHTGTYGITMPLSAASGPARTYNGVSLAPINIGPATVPLPPLEKTFSKVDVCKWIEDFLASLPGDHPPDVCGKERHFEVGSGVTVSVAGTLDSLVILGGHLAITGDMDVDLTVDGGGISGGRAPRFYPCYQAAYVGCLTTPTGAAFIDWIRQYVPALPEASLPPVRVCVPGLPVRTKAGYWYWTGWTPHWVQPVYEKCSVSDWGQLPTVVLPSLSESHAEVRPFIKGDMTFKVKGDGQLGLKIGIPFLSASAAYVVGNDFKAKASVGVFVGLSVALKNGGATILATFEDSVKSTQAWTPSGGWDGDTKVPYSQKNAQILELDNPDSVLVRLSVPIEAGAELCIAIISCEEEKPKEKAPGQADSGPEPVASGLFDIAIGAKAKVAVSQFAEATWNRPVVNPSDSSIDNWNLDLDEAYDLTLEAGVKIPLTGWILPQVPREWKKTWECCRVSVGDLWGRGHLLVGTTTTGTNPDPDGYQVTVARYDTLPLVVESGATRLGKARDHGEPLDLPLGPTDSVVFDPGAGPCSVFYSDALFFGNPVWMGAVDGLRAVGVGIPDYAITANCQLLIARYTVTLSGVSDDCQVTGGPVRDAVWLQQRNRSIDRSDTTRVHFDVVCNGADPLGDLQITTHATTTPDYTDDYQIDIDGFSWGRIGPNATDTLTGLRAGTHTVTLSGGPHNCGAPAPADADVPASGVGTVILTASPCFLPDTYTPGEVTVTAATSGGGTDADGYQVKLDGVLKGAMTPNAAAKVGDVPALVPSVIQVSNLASNCRATTLNPFMVTLDSVATPIGVPFGASCTSSAIDTLQGVVESSAWPTPSVSLRLDSGELRSLSGALRNDLMQLAGMPVRVWGVTSGTTTDLYGYELRSTLDDPRWVGIVTLRGSDVWLFGEDAIQLLDASPGLKAAAGALIWVSGTQDGESVRPTAFGVIREAQP